MQWPRFKRIPDTEQDYEHNKSVLALKLPNDFEKMRILWVDMGLEGVMDISTNL